MRMSETDLLKKELLIFEQHRHQWVETHPGKYVVIQGDMVVDGFFETYAEALRAGLHEFGAARSFLVKQVWKTEPVYFIS